MGRVQERADAVADASFLGGPSQDFEAVGRLGFRVLLSEGLNPSSRVLDVGCGALRLGYWLMRFLDPGCYFGIEPNQEMLRVGLEQIVEPEVVQRADARFAHNDDFDFSVFATDFDYVYARSIWTHASRSQISIMLRSFAATATPKGVFLASYHAASPVSRQLARWPRVQRAAATRLPLEQLSPVLARLPEVGLGDEYQGEDWVGRSHQSSEQGVIRHSLRWIAAEAGAHGLRAQLAPYPFVNRQYWLRITRA